ncbi:hypothetical protein PHYSODRAFT_263491 [Phytophthora sojae]|uniref:Uncharacterized protein n=1 Tax=Phytophthora sojae (strain P6497) TaxID=1094619 RepID=G4YQ12_PHYSP|nr:hypothetical protein PHYSODRAFT_263491 [Phytophthora sojae]EGZ29327.1 hypothetical protein PHYSODRAFT_263491 [Phytophthora sojae]|eukprot:XP_009516602.1 hypothetical protein PHYSODRAFT_263491 [Phytophthora sojae]
MRAVAKKLAHKLREAQARRRNLRFPFHALGQRFLRDLVSLTSRIGWDSVDVPIYSCWNRVMEQLWPYYGTDTCEGRLLVDLATFAPVCQILIAAIDTAVKIVSADED